MREFIEPRLEAALTRLGFPTPHVMGGSGGVFTVAEGLEMPAMAVESGPAAGVIAMTPICPHTLSNRPIAVSDRSRIEITLKTAVDALLYFDGQPQVDLLEGDRVIVRRADHPIRFVHPPGYSYFAMLREKLHWSEMY